jgi:hypothetical protein
VSLGPRLPEFDVLVALHRHDPEAFEAFRRHILKEAVGYAPLEHRPALEDLLDRIEEERAKARTPMEAVLGATRMMHDSVRQLNDGWQRAREAVADLQAALIIERARH